MIHSLLEVKDESLVSDLSLRITIDNISTVFLFVDCNFGSAICTTGRFQGQ